jgi:hypothetical protein
MLQTTTNKPNRMNSTIHPNNIPLAFLPSQALQRGAWGAVITLGLSLTSLCQAISTHSSDFIADGTRTHFNGFEGMPITTTGAPLYIESNIRVEQINGDGNDIWTLYSTWGPQGSRSWYPNGGDNGYTRITMADGSEFGDIGFLRGSGNSSHVALIYQLFNNGALVASSFTSHTWTAQYLGFSGGGFDEIRLQDSSSFAATVGNGTHNALALDSIEVRQSPQGVPDGGYTLALMGCALTGLSMAGKRRKDVTAGLGF